MLRFFIVLSLFFLSCKKETDRTISIPKNSKSILKKISSHDLSPWQKSKINWKQFQGTTLSILADAQPAFTALKPILPIFEELTGMQIGYQNMEQMRMRKVIRIDLTARAGIYDILPVGVIFLGEAEQHGWLEDLYPYIHNPELTDFDWYDFKDISKQSLVLCKKNSKLLSIPFDFSAPIFFYRKDLFKKYNISIPNTYEDVILMKKKLQAAMEKDGIKDVYAFATRARPGLGDNTWTIIPTIRAYGGDILNKEYLPIFNSKEANQALKVYKEMVTGYGNPPDARTLHFYEIRELFKIGKLASTILASHFFSEIDSPEKSPIWDKWDAHITPGGPVSRETNPWAWSFAINSSSKNKGATWLFIQWATSKETAKLLKSGGAPARMSIWESNAYQHLNAPGLIRSVRWILKKGTISSVEQGIPEFSQVGEITSRAFSEIFYGADIQTTLNTANKKVYKIMINGSSYKN
ncbi:MAG: extracellular solute-binding protein, partial [Leptospiraceae bacterium]|nr:extracellular solute-binding protein [Leptospiraceae bacterium]